METFCYFMMQAELMTEEPPTGATKRRSDFFTTRWSVVMTARNDDEASREGALETLCRAYWYPLYSFARRTGNSAHDAQDLTQDFFSHLIRTGALKAADEKKGRFRSFLLASFRNVMTNEWRRRVAAKRGGGQTVFSLDDESPETKFRREAVGAELTPERAYEKRWAETLVDRSLNRLRDEWEKGGRPFDKLQVFLVGHKGDVRFADLAEELSVSVSALKTSVHRMRKRFGEIFRDEVSQTVSEPGEVDDEVRHLLSALSS